MTDAGYAADITANLLGLSQRELQNVLVPELTSRSGKGTAGMLAQILGYLADDVLKPRADRDFASEATRLLGEGDDIARRLDQNERAFRSQEVAVSHEALDRMIADHLGGGEAVSFERIGGGYSKDSFFFDFRDASGELCRTVLRRDMPFGPNGYTVVDEYQLLRNLYPSDLKIAEPIACITVYLEIVDSRLTLDPPPQGHLARHDLTHGPPSAGSPEPHAARPLSRHGRSSAPPLPPHQVS